jgi:hypothetical protein
LRFAVAALAFALSACAGAPSPELIHRGYQQPVGWKAVLIAGDDQEPAFDNAVEAVADKLAEFGVRRADMVLLKSDGAGDEAATRRNVEEAFANLRPGARDGCFVFVTSHGLPEEGLVMTRARAYLRPGVLSELINLSCRDNPTVTIASGCFSGAFAEGDAMPAKNRVILTAARRDRPSFGCNANLRYTVFDRCILENLTKGIAWAVVMNKARDCVADEERRLRVQPSEPQISIGDAVTDLKVFSR